MRALVSWTTGAVPGGEVLVQVESFWIPPLRPALAPHPLTKIQEQQINGPPPARHGPPPPMLTTHRARAREAGALHEVVHVPDGCS